MSKLNIGAVLSDGLEIPEVNVTALATKLSISLGFGVFKGVKMHFYTQPFRGTNFFALK